MDDACWVFLLLAFTGLGHKVSGSFESVQWNACVHRLDLGLYSHPKEVFEGMESEAVLTPREKSPLPEKFLQRRIEPMTLHQAGQQAQLATNRAVLASCGSKRLRHLQSSVLPFPFITTVLVFVCVLYQQVVKMSEVIMPL